MKNFLYKIYFLNKEICEVIIYFDPYICPLMKYAILLYSYAKRLSQRPHCRVHLVENVYKITNALKIIHTSFANLPRLYEPRKHFAVSCIGVTFQWHICKFQTKLFNAEIKVYFHESYRILLKIKLKVNISV